MDQQQVIKRMDELMEAARARFPETHQVGTQYAELLWMTQEEASEFLELRLNLKSNGEIAAEALQRIRIRRGL